MKTFDLEAHYYTKSVFDYLMKREKHPKMVSGKEPATYNLLFTDLISLFQSQQFIDTLNDIGTSRIDAMDKAGLDVQVLSFSSPGIDEFDPDHQNAASFATELNDILHDATKKYPKRFLGFAAIAPYDIKRGVKELERSINQLGFVGWLAHSNFGEDLYFDDAQYWPLLEAAQDLDIPIYLHPTTPLMKEFGKYGFSLGGPPLGFQFDVSLCLLRMIYAGVFDQFPGLKIILGHLGETLPMLVPDRIDWAYINPGVASAKGFIEQRPKIKKTPSEVILENVYITTSGRFSKPALDYVLQVMGEDRVMLATDYPYENLMQSMNFIKGCDLPDEQLKKVCYLNANKLGIKLK